MHFLLAPICAMVMSAGSPAGDFDLLGFIDAQLKGGQTRIVVPPGRYRVTPRSGRHLFFKDVEKVEIVADKVEMICTQTCPAMMFEHCRDMRVTGLTIDYDPLPFTQGRITAMADDKSWVEFKIIDGYPQNKLEERVEIYDPATGELRRETPGFSKDFESLGDGRYRAIRPKSYRYRADWDTEQIGDILVTNHLSPEGRGGHAVSIDHCSGVKLENITVYASPCMGFVEHGCDAMTYLRCRLDRRSPADDPVKRGFARMRSLDADGFHSTEAMKGPSIIECTAKYQGDDCVNIHGTYYMVMGSSGNVLRIVATGRMNIQDGDPVEFLPFEGSRPADAVATKVEADGLAMTAQEQSFIAKLNMNQHHKERLLSGKSPFFKLTLDRPTALAMGSLVCAGNRVGNGFVVKGCDFGYNRSRGILIKASKGEVVGNRITRSWMAAVLVAPEYWWPEASSSRDLLVGDNVITGCRRIGIEVIAPGGNHKPLLAGAHENITISGNKIVESAWPNIRVTSTRRLVMKENQLTASEPRGFVPPIAGPWNWKGAQPAAVILENCEQVEGP